MMSGAAGAGFSVFYVPARFEVNDEAWTFVQRRYETERPWTGERCGRGFEALAGRRSTFP